MSIRAVGIIIDSSPQPSPKGSVRKKQSRHFGGTVFLIGWGRKRDCFFFRRSELRLAPEAQMQ